MLTHRSESHVNWYLNLMKRIACQITRDLLVCVSIYHDAFDEFNVHLRNVNLLHQMWRSVDVTFYSVQSLFLNWMLISYQSIRHSYSHLFTWDFLKLLNRKRLFIFLSQSRRFILFTWFKVYLFHPLYNINKCEHQKWLL